MKPEIVTPETSSLVLALTGAAAPWSSCGSKASNWNVIKRPKLGLSWRMMLPLEGKRNNEAWGHKQPDAPRVSAQMKGLSLPGTALPLSSAEKWM